MDSLRKRLFYELIGGRISEDSNKINLTQACEFRPGVLGLGAKVRIYWNLENGYSIEDVSVLVSSQGVGSEFVSLNGFDLIANTQILSDGSFRTDIPSNILAGYIGLGSLLEIGLEIEGQIVSVVSNAGLIGGIGGSCRNVTPDQPAIDPSPLKKEDFSDVDLISGFVGELQSAEFPNLYYGARGSQEELDFDSVATSFGGDNNTVISESFDTKSKASYMSYKIPPELYENKLSTIGRKKLKEEIVENVESLIRTYLYGNRILDGSNKSYTIDTPISTGLPYFETIDELKQNYVNEFSYEDIDYIRNSYSLGELDDDHIYLLFIVGFLGYGYDFDSNIFVELMGQSWWSEYAAENISLMLEDYAFPEYLEKYVINFDDIWNMYSIVRDNGTLGYKSIIHYSQRILSSQMSSGIKSFQELQDFYSGDYSIENPAKIMVCGAEFYKTISEYDGEYGYKEKLDGTFIENVLVQPVKEISFSEETTELITVSNFDNTALYISTGEWSIEQDTFGAKNYVFYIKFTVKQYKKDYVANRPMFEYKKEQ